MWRRQLLRKRRPMRALPGRDDRVLPVPCRNQVSVASASTINIQQHTSLHSSVARPIILQAFAPCGTTHVAARALRFEGHMLMHGCCEEKSRSPLPERSCGWPRFAAAPSLWCTHDLPQLLHLTASSLMRFRCRLPRAAACTASTCSRPRSRRSQRRSWRGRWST